MMPETGEQIAGLTRQNAESVSLREATRVCIRNGFSVVDTEGYQRLRAWCDLNGWPPADWWPSAQIDGSGAAS